MKILIIHNHYLESGGEDSVVSAEIDMLRYFGEQVILYERSNDEINTLSFRRKIYFALKDIMWSNKTYHDIKQIIFNEKPDIAHIHNPFIMMSPSLYYALKEENIPIVQTLHNYRLFCLNGLFYRKGKICQLCKGRNYLPALMHKCWRGSFLATKVFIRMLESYKKLKVFEEKVQRFIVLSKFSKSKFIKAGLCPEKIDIKPNFVDVKTDKRIDFDNYALYIGRLVDYKGVNTLLKAYELLGSSYHLIIIGDGPLYIKIKHQTRNYTNIEVFGCLAHGKAMEYLRKCAFLIFPSECYENMPRTIIESYAWGVPVLASNIGVVRELVQEGITGFLFKPGDSLDLANKIKYMSKNRVFLEEMGGNALEVCRQNYSQEKNYQILIDVYIRAIKQNSKTHD